MTLALILYTLKISTQNQSSGQEASLLRTGMEIALDLNWIVSAQIRMLGFHEENGRKFLTLKSLQSWVLSVGWPSRRSFSWKLELIGITTM